ncbi:MAG: response regulator, partial [Alphaproteobacteria bacterium]
MSQHLLIVEDDEFVLSLLGAHLQGGGFKVSLASSGREMLAMLDKDPVHLILLDLSLPDEDGLALLRQVRAR